MDGNEEMRHSIHRLVDTDLKSAQDLVFRDTGHFISSAKFKIGLHYSPLVKLAHGYAKVIHVATGNDGFNIGSMRKLACAFWSITVCRILTLSMDH